MHAISIPTARLHLLAHVRVRVRAAASQGERFFVNVPPNAGSQIEIIVPARCLPSAPASEPSAKPTAGNASARMAAGGGARAPRTPGALPPGLPPAAAAASGGGDVAWTLCRRFDVEIVKPAGSPLGLALAPSRAGHLTVTDVTAGGVASSSGAFQLGDMLVAMDGAYTRPSDARSGRAAHIPAA